MAIVASLMLAACSNFFPFFPQQPESGQWEMMYDLNDPNSSLVSSKLPRHVNLFFKGIEVRVTDKNGEIAGIGLMDGDKLSLTLDCLSPSIGICGELELKKANSSEMVGTLDFSGKDASGKQVKVGPVKVTAKLVSSAAPSSSPSS